MVELHGERYHFVGRRDGIINVGGLKVHPEEVEAVINSSSVGADGAGQGAQEPDHRRDRRRRGRDEIGRPATTALKDEILDLCRRALPAHKVPAAIRFVPSLGVALPARSIAAMR